MPACDACHVHGCITHALENLPKNCPCLQEERPGQLYTGEEYTIAHNAALVESEGYGRNTRVEEIMDFAHKCGYHKIGLAFCSGFQAEADIFAKILRKNGFAVESVICKNGSHSKACLGVSREQQVRPQREFEPMCNPIGQAMRLAEAGTELNVILGLCVGHDTLFMRHSAAPATVLAVKDRALAHNPAAALYIAVSYLNRVYRFIETKYPAPKTGE